jgi:DNA-binding response OmpR family regulator
MKILVIDDDDRMRRMIGRILRLGGHQVVASPDGVSGMRVFREERPEIVVTDIIMPEQEGLGTIMMMRRERPDVKVIAMSGGGRIGNLDVLDAARTLGASDVIGKPFKPRDFLSRINRIASGDSGAASKTVGSREDPSRSLQRLAAMSRAARRIE